MKQRAQGSQEAALQLGPAPVCRHWRPHHCPWPAPSPCPEASPFSPAEFQKEAEPEGRKKGKFKTMKVLKLLGNKRDTKSKSPGDKS